MALFILLLFTFSIGFIFLYSLVQLDLILQFFKSKKRQSAERSVSAINYQPTVTIQLPVYNEIYVAERLIDNICKIDYPTMKLQIQVLDDSDDATTEIIAARVNFWAGKGIQITHVRRDGRDGYKAGALAHGLTLANGDFISVFDADFLPQPDFLIKVMPHFADDKTGVVQTRWTYNNADYSFLTQAQEFALNGHFVVEQTGRNTGQHFINFNGTAGVWRKSVIETSGGWQSDTLTEDLDLSYRAQLNGWHFKYLSDVEAPSELPVDLNSLRAQQFRWTKGAAQCVKKNLLSVLTNKNISIGTKWHAFFHLTNSTVFVFVFLLSLLILPVTLIKSNSPDFVWITRLSSGFMVSWFILAFFYWVANGQKSGGFWEKAVAFVWKFPLFLAISMGLGLHNSIAVIEGYIGQKSAFMRTPKFNIRNRDDKWENNIYLVQRIAPVVWLEGIMFLYSIASLQIGIIYFSPGLLPMNVLLVGGYGIVFLGSLIHIRRSVREFRYREVF